MELTFNDCHIIDTALAKHLTSENLTQIFDTEEIIAIKNLLNLSEYMYIESLLFAYADKQTIPEAYMNALSEKKHKEDELISKTVSKIKGALKNAPNEIKNFLNLYALESLDSNFDVIKEKTSKLLRDQKNVKFLENLNKELGLDDPIFALNLLKAIRSKYADKEETYYINLLIWQSKQIALGLLYIFIEI